MLIKKRFKTETAHIVRGAVSERCKHSLHGHSYKFDVTIEGELGDNGMVLDFIELKPIGEFIDSMDHATVFWDKDEQPLINFFKSSFDRVVIMKKNTTAENMARLIFNFAKSWLIKKGYSHLKVKQVDVWETETGCGIATECDEDDIIVFKNGDYE